MFRAHHKLGPNSLVNLKMRAVSTHYGDVLKGTKLGSLLNRSLMPDEELNLTEELALTRHIASEAVKDYALALRVRDEKDTPQTREMVTYAGAILKDKLKDVKDMCESASKLQNNLKQFNLGTLNFGDILSYVMGVVNNNASTTIDAERIETDLRENFKALEGEENSSLITRPSDDKIVEEMDISIPKLPKTA